MRHLLEVKIFCSNQFSCIVLCNLFFLKKTQFDLARTGEEMGGHLCLIFHLFLGLA